MPATQASRYKSRFSMQLTNPFQPPAGASGTSSMAGYTHTSNSEASSTSFCITAEAPTSLYSTASANEMRPGCSCTTQDKLRTGDTSAHGSRRRARIASSVTAGWMSLLTRLARRQLFAQSEDKAPTTETPFLSELAASWCLLPRPWHMPSATSAGKDMSRSVATTQSL